MASVTEEAMTKLTIGSTDLSEYVQSMRVTVGPPPEPYKHSYTQDHPSLSRTVVIPDCRLSVARLVHHDVDNTEHHPYRWESVHDSTVRRTHIKSPVMEWVDPLKNWPDTNLLRLIRKALRTYPKRMSRAQRKEARAREQRRLERNRKQITRSR